LKAPAPPRLLKSTRGVSTVIGAIFFVVILLMGSSLLIIQARQFDEYVQTVNERARLDWERQNEAVEIESVSVVDGKLNLTVRNEGSVTAHVVSLWITERPATLHKSFPISCTVRPGETVTNVGQELEVQLSPERTYEVKLVTERGNIAVATYSWLDEVPPSVQAFGVFSLDWFYFKYSSEQTNGIQVGASCINKSESYVAFYVKVINNYYEEITILSASMVMLMTADGNFPFYIVENVGYDPQSIDPYNDGNPVTVEPQQTAVLTFAASESGEDEWAWAQSLPGIGTGQDEGAIAMIALVFEVGDSEEVQAQTLPFQALVLKGQ